MDGSRGDGALAGGMEGGHQSTSRLDGGIPSAGVRRNSCWTPPPFFGGGVGPTTTEGYRSMNGNE